LYADEAAVELLIGHAWWLDRGDFVEVFVETGRGLACGELMAWVDWQAAVAALEAGRLACSGGEARVLRIAASVAEGVPVDLCDALAGVDQANLALVATAVLHAGGRRGAVVAGLAGMVTR
jgi:hypothetical protein